MIRRAWHLLGVVGLVLLVALVAPGTAQAAVAAWTWPTAADRLPAGTPNLCAVMSAVPPSWVDPGTAGSCTGHNSGGIDAAVLAGTTIEVPAAVEAGGAAGPWGLAAVAGGLLVYGALDYYFGDGVVTFGKAPTTDHIVVKTPQSVGAGGTFVPNGDVPFVSGWGGGGHWAYSWPDGGDSVTLDITSFTGTTYGSTAGFSVTMALSGTLTAGDWLGVSGLDVDCVGGGRTNLSWPGLNLGTQFRVGSTSTIASGTVCAGSGTMSGGLARVQLGNFGSSWQVQFGRGCCIAAAEASYAYYPPGYPSPPSGITGPDPSRQIVASYSCVASDGTRRTLTAYGALYTEGGIVAAGSAGIGDVLPEMPCLPTESFGGATLDEVRDGSDLGVVYTVPDPTTQPGLSSIWDAARTSSAVATLTLEKSDGAGGWADCFVTAGLCSGWWSDPAKADTYQCVSGGTVVALSSCDIYRPTFEPGQPTYGDPTTGAYTPVTVEDPTGGAGSDDVGGACWPAGWGAFNPFAWIYMPIKCALKWAFVPSSDQWSSVTTGFSDGWHDTSMYAWWTAISASFMSLSPPEGACTTMTVEYPKPGGGSFPMQVLDPCTGPMATVAGVSRNATMIAAALFGGLGVWRGIMTVGFGIGTPTPPQVEEQLTLW